jgi:hypothetical protein
MAFFKSDPLKAMQQSVDSARANRDRLTAKLAECDATVIARKNATQAIALDASADETALDKAERAIRAAKDRATTISGAIVEAEKLLAKLENDLADAADKQTRAATAVETDAMKTEIKTVGHEAIVAITKLANVAERAGMCVPEARGLHAFCVSSGTQIPDAVALIVKLLGDHSAAVLAGSAPASLKRPEAPYVEKPVLPAPTQIVFCLRSIKWRDTERKQQLAGKFTDAYLPPQLVAKALKSGACIAISDPRRKQFHHTQNEQPRADTALNLDADAEPKSIEPIMVSSPFTVVERGPAIPMKVAR